VIIQRFFRASGWQVWNCIAPNIEDVAHIAAESWLSVIGFSFSFDTHFEALRKAIARIRAVSLNKSIGIIVGGSAINRNPEWPTKLGADGSASSGPAAVLLANRIQAEAIK
jgi:methanogenic corrinoid protein MtbC1